MLVALLLAALLPLELSAPDLELGWHARLPVELRNTGPEPLRVGLAAEAGALHVAPAEGLELPRGGARRVELDVFRGRAEWGSRQRLRLVARDPRGLAVGLVELEARVTPDPHLLPRLRWPLLALGLTLLGAALLLELRQLPRA